jgi:TolA-binding protein
MSRRLPKLLRTLPALCALALSGCVATTTDVDRLADSLSTLQKSQADLTVKMDQLDSNLASLNERLTESQKKTSQLIQKLDDLQARLGSRMEGISQLLSAATTQASVPVPSEVYRTAYGDYLSGKTDLAITEFRSFISRYPDSELADDAQFYLADGYLAKQNYAQARTEIDKYLSNYTELRSAALLKRARALEGLKKDADQKATLEALLKEFPDSAEAATAQQMLKDLEPEPKKPAPKGAKKAP